MCLEGLSTSVNMICTRFPERIAGYLRLIDPDLESEEGHVDTLEEEERVHLHIKKFQVQITVATCIASISVTQCRSRRFNILSNFLQGMWDYIENYETYSFHTAPCNGLQDAVVQYAANHTSNTRALPSNAALALLHWSPVLHPQG